MSARGLRSQLPRHGVRLRWSTLAVPMAGPVVVAVVGAMGLSGCTGSTPAATTSTPPPSATTAVGSTGPNPPPTVTTTALPGMPVPLSTGPSPVDPAAITSLDALPRAFGCPSVVSPITIPAATPTASAGAADPTPAVVVCGSTLAHGEALYLWYAPTPQAKLAALTAALKQTKYVHGGPTWVAGGTVDKTMGTVGGEVYR
ncbi:MAG: hypothetical protein ABI083_17445 [Lapillicoccus sp.]